MSARTLTAALAAMLVATTANAQVAQYVVSPLPHPGGTSPYLITGAAGMNNAGQVASTVRTTTTGLPPNHAARFTPGVGTVDLGSLFPTGTSTGRAINVAGQVVGDTANAQANLRAFLYTDGVGMVDLGVLPGHTGSQAFGINDAGVVVGTSTSGAVAGRRAFRYTTTAGMTDLGVPPSASNGLGVAINNAGEVVVTGQVAGATRTFRYTDANGYQDIGTLGGTDTTGEAISTSGIVVGASRNAVGQSRAFRQMSAGGLRDLGILPGFTDSFAVDVNDVGDVVGRVAVGSTDRAVLYRDGLGLVDLNGLIETGTGWTLLEATSINDLGQIAGTGLLGGNLRAFLLTPIPEPSALLLTVACAAGAVFRRYGRSE